LLHNLLSEATVVAHQVNLTIVLGAPASWSTLPLLLLGLISSLLREKVAEINTFVDQSCLDELQSLINFRNLLNLLLSEKLSVEERQIHVLLTGGLSLSHGVLVHWGVKTLRHDIEQELKLITLNLDIRSEHRLNELKLCDVAIASLISGCQRLLQGDLAVGESLVPDLVDDLFRTLQTDLLIELNFFTEISLNKVDLYAPSMIGIQLIQDLVLLLVLKAEMMTLLDIMEVFNHTLPGCKIGGLHLGRCWAVVLQELCVETVLSDVVSEFLNCFFRPALHSLQKLALMTIVEVFN
jgi:hypothetical protein